IRQGADGEPQIGVEFVLLHDQLSEFSLYHLRCTSPLRPPPWPGQAPSRVVASSFLISGRQEPQLVPAWTRSPTWRGSVSASLAMRLRSVLRPTAKQEHTSGPASSPARNGRPARSARRSTGCKCSWLKRDFSQLRAGSSGRRAK